MKPIKVKDTVKRKREDNDKQRGKVGIIIGFSYTHYGKSQELPGYMIDLYIPYKHAVAIGCSKIIVVTDDTDHILNANLLNLIISGQIDSGINFFFDFLKKTGELIHFTTMDEFKRSLFDAATDATNLFVYYSGHARGGLLLVPKYRHKATYRDGQTDRLEMNTLVISQFMKSLISKTRLSCRIIVITDCCESDSLQLPYELHAYLGNDQLTRGSVATIVKNVGRGEEEDTGNSPRRKKDVGVISKRDSDAKDNNYDKRSQIGGRYRLKGLEEGSFYDGRDVICISVSKIGGTAFSTYEGSQFTIELFKTLNDTTVTSYTTLLFMLVLDFLKVEDVMPNIHSTYPNNYLIQPWVRHNTTMSIHYDTIQQAFRITL